MYRSAQGTMKKIQELSKINIFEPPSLQASMPLSLQVPVAKCLGGIREAQTISRLGHPAGLEMLVRLHA